MEALADKICKEELGQEPNETNLAFRKTLVHGMVRWNEESKVKNLSSKPLLADSLPCEHMYSRSMNQEYPRKCVKCGEPEKANFL